MLTVVSYDIPSDPRRQRVRNALKNFGPRVQYSVFECVLEPEQFDRLQHTLSPLISKPDHLRYYRLCEDCHKRIVAIGGVVTRQTRTLVI